METPKGKSIHLTWDQMNTIYTSLHSELDDLYDIIENPDAIDTDGLKWTFNRLRLMNQINKKMCKAFNIMDQYQDWEERNQ